MIRVGILGAGTIAAVMAKTIHKMNENGNNSVCLYAIASRKLESAERFAKEHQVPKAYGSYQQMLEDEDVDLVYVAAPHSHHYQYTKLSVEHGKHVLCEKAFTVNARQAQEVLCLAEQKGVLVTEGIWTRYQPMRSMIKELLDSGVIGQPKMLTANLCYNIADVERIARPELAGGALLDVGVYALNFAEMMFGRADSVSGSCLKNEYGVDIADSITLTWNDGKMAALTAAATVVSDRMGVISGTDGYIIVENINNPQQIRVYDRNHQLTQQIERPAQLTGFEYEVAQAVSCIEQGLLECPSMPHAETIHMMELMDHLRAQMAVRYPFE